MFKAADMPATIGIVLNPRSRYMRKHPGVLGRLRDQLGARGVIAESKSLDGVRETAADFKARGIDVVGVCGGDGTAGITIAGFADVYGTDKLPAFALLRGGTMNTVSNALGLPRGTPLSNLQRLMRKTSNGARPTTVARSTLKADGRIGFLFGTGVFAGFLSAYYQKGKDDPSALTAFQTIAHAALSALVQGPYVQKMAAPVTCRVEVDGEVWPERDYLAVTAGTVVEVGLGFRAFHLADRYRGAFHLLAITGTTSEVVRDLPRAWLGLSLSEHNAKNVAARRVVITTPQNEVEFMVDGDLNTCRGPLVVETGPTVDIIV